MNITISRSITTFLTKKEKMMELRDSLIKLQVQVQGFFCVVLELELSRVGGASGPRPRPKFAI